MDFKEIENALISEFIYACMVNGSKDYFEMIKIFDELVLSKEIEKEIYDNLKIKNRFFIQVIIAYSFLYDVKVGNDISFYKLDVDEQVNRFFEDEGFAIYVIDNAFRVLKNKRRFTLNLSVENKEVYQRLTYKDTEVLSFNDQIKKIMKQLYDSLLRDGYEENEVINIMYIYWSRDFISPFLVEQYMPYEIFIRIKKFQLRMMIVEVYLYLLSNKDRDIDMLNYLESLSSLPSSDEEKKRIFGLFIKALKDGRKDVMPGEILQRIPLNYRVFTL